MSPEPLVYRGRLIGLLALCLLLALAYLSTGVKGSLSFALTFRGEKLAALVLVGISQAVAAVMFQTISGNRILTPAIMGFDALYVLLLSAAVMVLGGPAYQQLDPGLLMLVNAGGMSAAAVALFGLLLRKSAGDMLRMLLTGVVLAVMLRSVTGLLQRVIDPSEYAVVQAASYARFGRTETDLLGVAVLLCGGALALAWRMRHRLDVLALGPVAATSLGEPPLRGQRLALLLISVLVAVSTALVGPVAFFGLLVSALTYVVLPTHRHAILLPGAALIACIVLVGGQWALERLLACIVLVGGQWALERLLAFATPLSVVVECLGGLVFLFLLLKGLKR